MTMPRKCRFHLSQFDGWLIRSTLVANLRFRLHLCTRFDVDKARSIIIGAMHFVAVRAATTKMFAPYLHIIKNFDVCSTIHQTPMYRLLESVLGAKWR